MIQCTDQHISDFDTHDLMDSLRGSHTLVDNLVVLLAFHVHKSIQHGCHVHGIRNSVHKGWADTDVVLRGELG